MTSIMFFVVLAILVPIGIIFLLVGGIRGFNTFKRYHQEIKLQWSNLLSEYQRRVGLFYNLAQTVKSHKGFESKTFVDVAKARTGQFGSTKQEQFKTLKGLDGLFQRLMVVMERYPNLKSHQQHNTLMEEVRATEDRINTARADYNEVVSEYNIGVTTFPTNILASFFSFNEELYYNNALDDAAPEIDLEPKEHIGL